jgi:hypothetical protein
LLVWPYPTVKSGDKIICLKSWLTVWRNHEYKKHCLHKGRFLLVGQVLRANTVYLYYMYVHLEMLNILLEMIALLVKDD